MPPNLLYFKNMHQIVDQTHHLSTNMYLPLILLSFSDIMKSMCALPFILLVFHYTTSLCEDFHAALNTLYRQLR